MLIYLLYLEHIFRKNILFKQKLKYIYIINYIHNDNITITTIEMNNNHDELHENLTIAGLDMKKFANANKGEQFLLRTALTETQQELARIIVVEKGPPLHDGNRRNIRRHKTDAERAADLAALLEAQKNWDAFQAKRAPFAEAFNSARAAYQAAQAEQAAYQAPPPYANIYINIYKHIPTTFL